jgi:hypothetical protein
MKSEELNDIWNLRDKVADRVALIESCLTDLSEAHDDLWRSLDLLDIFLHDYTAKQSTIGAK